MPTYTKDQGGKAILADLTDRLGKARIALNTAKARDDQPVEYRRRMRVEAIAEAQRLAEDARQAFQGWAEQAAADARRRYHQDPVGSSADESRRVSNEMRISRLIDAARTADQRTGPRIVGGRPVDNPTAHAYAARAMELFLDGRYEESQAYASASTALGGPQSAQRAYDLSQGQLDLENPERAAVLKKLDEVDRGLATFEARVNGLLVDALQGAADAARAIADDPFPYMKQQAALSIRAKVAAMALANQTGEAYAPPEGALASGPTGEAGRSPDRETSRVEPHRPL